MYGFSDRARHKVVNGESGLDSRPDLGGGNAEGEAVQRLSPEGPGQLRVRLARPGDDEEFHVFG